MPVARLSPNRNSYLYQFVWSHFHSLRTATATWRRRFRVVVDNENQAGSFGKFQIGKFNWNFTQFGKAPKEVLWT